MLRLRLVIGQPPHKGTAESPAFSADQRLRRQPFQRLAHRGTRHVKGLGQVGFRRQTVIRRQLSGQDGIPERLGNLGGQIRFFLRLRFFHLSYI